MTIFQHSFFIRINKKPTFMACKYAGKGFYIETCIGIQPICLLADSYVFTQTIDQKVHTTITYRMVYFSALLLFPINQLWHLSKYTVAGAGSDSRLSWVEVSAFVIDWMAR